MNAPARLQRPPPPELEQLVRALARTAEAEDYARLTRQQEARHASR